MNRIEEKIMKKLSTVLFAVLFAVSVMGLVGCGSDDGNDTPADVVSTTDVPAVDEDVPVMEEMMEEVVEPAGACTNADDGALLATPEQRDAVTASATDCGIGCLGDDDVATCSVTCLVGATGLSVGCSACYAGMVGCSKDNCLAECLADPSGDACATCQTDAGCFIDFYACSGLPEPTE
jgi:hypothetical protein